MPDLIITNARIVPLSGDGSAAAPADLLVREGRIAQLAPGSTLATTASGAATLDADGRYVIPGLWDQHVHATQWARTATQLDTSGTAHPRDVLARVADALASRPDPAQRTLFGWGHRSASWSAAPTVAELDAVSGETPVVLVSGDGHHGWLNSAALHRLGVPPRDSVLAESDWFPVFGRLDELRDGAAGEAREVAEMVARAHARGIVGLTDMEFGRGWETWAERYAAGTTTLRVRTATYAETLDEAIAAGLRTGTPVPGTQGMIRMGPLKIISDGSLNTRTAWCREPYTDAAALQHPCGAPNVAPEELAGLFARGTAAGLEIACHAIGDAAIGAALDAFAASGARGGIEHAQLTMRDDVRRMAELGVHASVQPAHLWDDRDVTHQCWADRTDFSFMLRSMLDAGVTLTLGSDAPVSPLDPWLALAAAVHRSGDDRDPWNPAEAISVREALAASTGGVAALGVGARADLVLLDADPLDLPGDDTAAAADRLRAMAVAATVVNGRVVHSSIA